MTITLLRHAQVEETFIGKYNGHNDIGLSCQGKEDAKKLAQHFSHQEFDGVFCSDLRRAKETLAPFEQVSQAYYTASLREKSWGIHEGLSFEEICMKYKLHYENFEQWIALLDGEDYKVYEQRIKDFFEIFLYKKPLKNILIVTHAGVIRTLIKFTLNISLEESFTHNVAYGGKIVFHTEHKHFTYETIK
jgi:broad specificity phosphatase PhoE